MVDQLAFTHAHIEGVLVLTVTGDIDLATAPSVRGYLVDHLAATPTAVVVRMDQVTFLDSTGVTALVAAHRKATDQPTPFALACPSDPVRKVLELTSITKVIPTYDSVGAAVSRFATGA